MTAEVNRRALALVVLAAVVAIGCVSPRGGSPGADANSEPGPTGGRESDAAASSTSEAGAPPSGDGSAERSAPATTPVPPGHHRLTVTVAGPGTVSIPPGIGRCDSNCSFDIPAGTVVDLNASVAPSPIPASHTFRGWLDSCTGQTGCRIMMDADRAVTAKFHQFVLWEQPALGSGAVVGDALFVAGSFTGTQTLSGQTLSSRGMKDGWLIHCDLNGKPLSVKTLAGPADDSLSGIRRTGSGELMVFGSAGSGDVLYDGKPLGITGRFVAFLGPGGELRRAFPVPESFYSDVDGAGNLVTTEIAANGGPWTLVKRGTGGEVLWSKPPLAGETGFLYPSVDPLGNILVFHAVDAPIFLHAHYLPENGGQLLIKLSPEGDVLWEVQLGSDGGGGSGGARTDGAGDVYIDLGFVGPLRLGGKTIAVSVDGGADIGFAKLSRSQGSLLWFRSFASILPDRLATFTLDSADRLVAIGLFPTKVMVGTQTFDPGTLVIRLDPATGNVVDALDVGRPIYSLSRLPMGDFIYLIPGPAGLMGRLSLP